MLQKYKILYSTITEKFIVQQYDIFYPTKKVNLSGLKHLCRKNRKQSCCLMFKKWSCIKQLRWILISKPNENYFSTISFKIKRLYNIFPEMKSETFACTVHYIFTILLSPLILDHMFYTFKSNASYSNRIGYKYNKSIPMLRNVSNRKGHEKGRGKKGILP